MYEIIITIQLIAYVNANIILKYKSNKQVDKNIQTAET